MSDIIETYIKKILSSQEQVEIRRNEMAGRFNCVPSQINYVINTRFTEQHGYLVESKRGGGGYIRIIKLKFLDDADLVDGMIDIIESEITEREALAIVQNLYDKEIISKREGNLVLAVMEKTSLEPFGPNEDKIRAHLLIKLLKSLRYDV